MKSKNLLILLITAMLVSLSACDVKSTKDIDKDCEFDFLHTDTVEISRYKEHSYFKLNKKDTEFDISNLEFISENQDVATFSYDSTALGNYIYYNIEPISNGETDVYVKCKDCEAVSQKLHVIVTIKNNTATEANIVVTENPDENSINGRGRSDKGRSEPNYVGTVGYAVIYCDEEYELRNTDKFTDTSLWTIPTFEPDKQFWTETTITLPHKTEVKVLEQSLEHEGFGNYSGYLLVQKLDDSQNYYINVSNYVTKPYWTYNDNLRDAALSGAFIAEYNQVSDYYPVSRSGEKVTLEDGINVLVTGISGDSNHKNEIEATVWKDWKYGYDGVSVYFNAEDLTIIY